MNYTSIRIPLGFGINIGWGNGFSLGGYGEVGYKVGGTGFGSRATVSQSFDYNFKIMVGVEPLQKELIRP